MPAFSDRRLLAKAGVALLTANLRFWPTVAPLVGAQLKRWERHAHQIKEPVLQTLALEKLQQEHFNAQVAATLATTAPAARRRTVVEAIVAYEVIYDYLDGLTELPMIGSLTQARHAYTGFIDAISPHNSETSSDYYAGLGISDSGYLATLVATVRDALKTLPSWPSASETATHAARRCAEAQARAHTTSPSSLQRWAESQACNSSLTWREFICGAASSVLAVHALIAAAAAPHLSREDARRIDTAYLSICAISTLLDGLVDYQHDLQAGQAGYLSYYQTDEQIAQGLIDSARHALEQARDLPHAGHHAMTLAGVAAYYLSAPTAKTKLARSITHDFHDQLRPLITPTFAVMRAWRTAKHTSRSRGA